MTDAIRRLTPAGVEVFRQFVQRAAAGESAPAPILLLTDPSYSEPATFDAVVDKRVFATRYELGVYLVQALASVPVSKLSRDHGLWTWLALYWFDQLAPLRADGTRRLYRPETIILPEKPDYTRYYRHFIRTPWLAVQFHEDAARVLLMPPGQGKEPPLARRGELVEQLSSRQWIFGNRKIIRAAFEMYFDTAANRVRRGAGGSGGGSPRRLATIVDQLELTWDLQDCSPAQVIALLPTEFDRWRHVGTLSPLS